MHEEETYFLYNDYEDEFNEDGLWKGIRNTGNTKEKIASDFFKIPTKAFYNLVPSCPQCNHLKKVQELDVNPRIGYRAEGRPKFRVDTSNGDFPARPEILIDGENENTKKLGVKELYNEHKDYVKDILNKIQAYNPVTYGAIKRDFQGIAYTEAELERMVWGNSTREEDMNRRPMAKLMVDILEQYKKFL